jgi:hypothetical protein
MEPKYFMLEPKDGSKVVRIFQFALGFLSIGIAVFWVIFNLSAVKEDRTLWVTIIFLVAFGAYMIMNALGKSTKFIIIGGDYITLKQNPVLPAQTIKASDIDKIIIHPLSVSFTKGLSSRALLRFGITYHEIIEPVKNEITDFAGRNTIPVDIVEDQI